MPEPRSKRFAMILQAIEDAEEDMANYRKDHASRMDTLRKELRALKMDELTGQLQLVPDPPDTPRITEAEELQPAGD